MPPRGVLRYIAVCVGSIFLLSLLAMLHRVHDREKVTKKSGKSTLREDALRQITKEDRKLDQRHLYLGDSDDLAVQSAFNVSDFDEDQEESLMTNQNVSLYDPFDETVTSEGLLVTKIPKQPPWTLNMTEVAMAKKGLRKYFNVVKRISLTKKDVQPGTIMHFDQSPENYVFSISPMLYDLLPERSPLQGMHHRKCAVIGNSGILLDSGCGNEIDKADFVFRCNFAPTKGYERDVGTKTNFTTFNGSILQYRFKYLATEKDRRKFLRFVQALGDAIFWMPVFTYHTNAIPARILTDFFWENRNKTNVKLAWLGNALKWINGYWRVKHQFKAYRLTSGVFMYTVAQAICDEIHLYGFYPFQEDEEGHPIPYHYYEPKEVNQTYSRVHKMDAENLVLRSLHTKGVLKLTTRKCDPQGSWDIDNYEKVAPFPYRIPPKIRTNL
ncbi:PREDICTED: sia-alpha-2,3-Gal-beta-1,4-GlcNAc-R:alpha 2,8-sialyltransferase-like isoform X1 [Branchiostoma belcheri]|uniref:Sia-alpha-2,3-Gal-beta-1,4-GlcNAc-R:alpha 2,8-sialyltransferase-like isoform X1 n=1 Tax=Branchiostoma belcheri TaxID=7741 RepID=A0A6P4Z0A3_BRABE|nr:PREDICTED: sia-alpha-2,3-Gal-beta-1,4-GlcNAc-R:alpha 2,8-sialyltransferase-like isoform X1 [Branchiostoma belcheri]